MVLIFHPNQDGRRTECGFPKLNLPLRKVIKIHMGKSKNWESRDTADRNNALAYFMREQGCFPNGANNAGGGVDIKNILDFYFQASSPVST